MFSKSFIVRFCLHCGLPRPRDDVTLNNKTLYDLNDSSAIGEKEYHLLLHNMYIYRFIPIQAYSKPDHTSITGYYHCTWTNCL